MKKNLLSTLLFLSYFLMNAQGPIDGYMKRGGETDFAFSYGYDHYTKYYLGDQLQDTFNRTYQSVSMFMAYGIDDNLGLVVSVPFMWTDKNNRNIQDGQFFLKYRPLRKEFNTGKMDLILAGGVTTALAKYKISPESNNPIGERPTIFDFHGVVQHNFHKGVFIMAKTGISYKVRPNVQASIPNLLRFGYAHSKFYTDAWIEGVFALNAEANTVPLGQEGSTFIKFGGTFYMPIGKRLGWFVNAAYTPWGRNIGISPRLGAGFVVKILPKTTE